VGFLSSLQGKLIATSILIVVVALALAGGVFVTVRRGDQRQQELDHVSANATAIQGEFLLRQLRGDSPSSLSVFVSSAAEDYDVRALMIDLDGQVVADSGDELKGSQISLEGSVVSQVAVAGGVAPYVTIKPAEGSPGSDLVLVAPPDIAPARPAFELIGGRQLRYSLVLAVSEDTLASAWLELLPELGLAAAIAIPVAVLLAVLIARYITRPLEQLTGASLQMASGRFDVDVPVGRDDEIGRLAQAFSTTAERVGQAQAQTRALVANVSHDMKTPLTSIIGFSQALRDESVSEAETRRMAGIIHEEAERLNARLNDLLYLAELESGRLVLHEDQINVDEMIARAAARVGPDVARRKITLTVNSQEQTVVRTDAQKLERVIENLLDNARKFTPDGGSIWVRQGNDDDRIWIEITNTAANLAPDELPRLFERFYRRDRDSATDGSRRRQAGSGLGLPIARDLAELLGGRLEASLRDGELVMRLALPSDSSASAKALSEVEDVPPSALR
jgi:signal transduction histidine kinase